MPHRARLREIQDDQVLGRWSYLWSSLRFSFFLSFSCVSRCLFLHVFAEQNSAYLPILSWILKVFNWLRGKNKSKMMFRRQTANVELFIPPLGISQALDLQSPEDWTLHTGGRRWPRVGSWEKHAHFLSLYSMCRVSLVQHSGTTKLAHTCIWVPRSPLRGRDSC